MSDCLLKPNRAVQRTRHWRRVAELGSLNTLRLLSPSAPDQTNEPG
jgi:hypothetical protein